MCRLSSVLVVSFALLSTFTLPSICSPSSNSFVVAAPSNSLHRDLPRLAERLHRILVELDSIRDWGKEQNEDDEEQEQLEDEQSAARESEEEDLPEGDQIVGTINAAESSPNGSMPPTQTNDDYDYARDRTVSAAARAAKIVQLALASDLKARSSSSVEQPKIVDAHTTAPAARVKAAPADHPSTHKANPHESSQSSQPGDQPGHHHSTQN